MPIGVRLIAPDDELDHVGEALPRDAAKYADPGAATFQHEVEFINNLPFLILIEITLCPIAFHPDPRRRVRDAGQAQHRRTSTRPTGVTLRKLPVGLYRDLRPYHVATRWGWTFLVPGGEVEPPPLASTLAAAIRGEDFTALAGRPLFYSSG